MRKPRHSSAAGNFFPESISAELKDTKETYYQVKIDLLSIQKRPIIMSKETYYHVKKCRIERYSNNHSRIQGYSNKRSRELNHRDEIYHSIKMRFTTQSRDSSERISLRAYSVEHGVDGARIRQRIVYSLFLSSSSCIPSPRVSKLHAHKRLTI